MRDPRKPHCGSDARWWTSPGGFALRRGDKVLVEPPGDLPHREIAFDIVPKDAPYNRCLWFVDFEMGGPVRAAGDAPIAVRALPCDHLASTRPPQLAAAVSLGDLGALILGDHALHLREQLGLRVIGQRRRVVERTSTPCRASSS